MAQNANSIFVGHGLAEELRIDRRTLQRVLAKRCVRSDTADRISIALGRHPGELWPEWFS
jgi:lambda repressor-like predicted transcriptional regulator